MFHYKMLQALILCITISLVFAGKTKKGRHFKQETMPLIEHAPQSRDSAVPNSSLSPKVGLVATGARDSIKCPRCPIGLLDSHGKCIFRCPGSLDRQQQ